MQCARPLGAHPGKPVADEVPFDNLTDRFLAYDLDDPKAALQELTDTNSGWDSHRNESSSRTRGCTRSDTTGSFTRYENRTTYASPTTVIGEPRPCALKGVCSIKMSYSSGDEDRHHHLAQVISN
jgi:hypothetical protein